MKELIVKGNKRLLLDKNDKCPICDTPRKDMYFRWLIFHGEAASLCCGAVYQLKEYFIENPTDEEKELLNFLAGEYIQFNIRLDYIEPLREAMKELEATNINDEGVIELATKKIATLQEAQS